MKLRIWGLLATAAFAPCIHSKREAAMKTWSIVAITAFAFLGLANLVAPTLAQISPTSALVPLQVTSSTFNNNDFLKIEAIDNSTIETSPGNFGNECAPGPKFLAGAKRSPPLSWTNVSFFVRSFVVIAFDNSAQVYHWGMYNIPSLTRTLPENAGVADSQFGEQTRNYSKALGYIGPCPPANEPPLVHDYVFTVYGLRQLLTEDQLPRNSDTEALQRAVTGLVVAQGSITGRWSSTCGQNPLYPCSQ